MKLLKYFLLFTLLLTNLNVFAEENQNKPALVCTGKDATLECAKKNMDTLYDQDYKLHSDILNAAYKKAVSCQKLADTAAYFETYTLQGLPVETSEAIHEEMENLALTKPKCFLDAVLLLNQDKQKAIIDTISSPFLDDGENTDKSLAPYRNNPRYKVLLEPFFKARKK